MSEDETNYVTPEEEVSSEFEQEAAAMLAANPGSVVVAYSLDEATVYAFDRWMETHQTKRIQVTEEWVRGAFRFIPGFYVPVLIDSTCTGMLSGWAPYTSRVLYKRVPPDGSQAVSIDGELGERLCATGSMWTWWLCGASENQWGQAEWRRRHGPVWADTEEPYDEEDWAVGS